MMFNVTVRRNMIQINAFNGLHNGYFIFHPGDHEVNNRNTAFMLQSHLQERVLACI